MAGKRGRMKNFIKKIELKIYEFLLKNSGKIVFEQDGTKMTTMTTISGDYIGVLEFNLGLMKFFFKHGVDLATLASAFGNSNVVAIAFSPKEQKWYGWSHRAIHGFEIGHVVKEGDCTTSSGFIESYEKEHPEENKSVPVGFKVTNLKEAKQVAIAFANSVS